MHFLKKAQIIKDKCGLEIYFKKLCCLVILYYYLRRNLLSM